MAVKNGLSLQGKLNPLLVRRGGCALNKNVAELPYSAQTGWSLTNHVPGVHSETWLESDHPGRSKKEASQHFFDLAATPPREGLARRGLCLPAACRLACQFRHFFTAPNLRAAIDNLLAHFLQHDSFYST